MNYFDKSYIKNNNSFLILGTHKKSFIIKDIIAHSNINYGFIITRSNDYNTIFQQNYRFPHLYQQTITEFKDIQNKYKYKSIIIIDSNENTKLINDKSVKELFYTHQCFNTSIIFTLDKAQDIDTNNMSYIIILKEDNKERRIGIYNMFITIFKTFETFDNIMNQLTYRHVLIIQHDTYYIYSAYLQRAFPLF